MNLFHRGFSGCAESAGSGREVAGNGTVDRIVRGAAEWYVGRETAARIVAIYAIVLRNGRPRMPAR